MNDFRQILKIENTG